MAVAAAQPSVAGDKYFIHHADHQLTLGIHVPQFQHVDLTSNCYFSCRDSLNVCNVRYWPLVCDDLGSRDSKNTFMKERFLRTCSSGGQNKFEEGYIYEYAEIIPHLLHETQGEHIHIGPLSPHYIERIHRRLTSIGVVHERFVHIPWVESVWQALIEHNVDIYLTSWPLGGGKALVEAMGAGIPVLMHVNPISRFHSSIELGYEKALTWRSPAELFSQLSTLDTKKLAEHSNAAREHYEKHHAPTVLQSLLNGDDDKGPEPLSLRPYQPDRFLAIMSNIERREAFQEQIGTLTEAVRIRDKSICWRITSPLRTLSRLIRRVIKR